MQIFKTYKIVIMIFSVLVLCTQVNMMLILCTKVYMTQIDSQWNNKGIVQYFHQLICEFQQHISQQHSVNNLISIFSATLSKYFCSYSLLGQQ
jgi:hypothetical protein